MNNYYAGLPYSDELYHHGILGQKWGQRRFQNEDGSLTEEGRKRYNKGPSRGDKIKSGARVAGQYALAGAKAVGRTAAKGAGRLGEGLARGVKLKLAEKMPFMLNDEEIERYRNRLNLENTYRNEQANRRQLKNKSKGDQFLKKLGEDILSTSAKTVAAKAVGNWADEKFKTKDQKKRDKLQMEKAEYELSKARFENSQNQFKADFNNDVAKQVKDEAKARKLDSDIAKAQAEFDRYSGDNDIVMNPNALKAQRELKKLKKERSDLDSTMQERDKSIQRRREMLDTTLNDNYDENKESSNRAKNQYEETVNRLRNRLATDAIEQIADRDRLNRMSNDDPERTIIQNRINERETSMNEQRTRLNTVTKDSQSIQDLFKNVSKDKKGEVLAQLFATVDRNKINDIMGMLRDQGILDENNRPIA